MRFNKTLLVLVGLGFLLLTGTVYAASTDFFPQAKKYIDDNCNKKKLANQTALLCFLFYKSAEHDQSISAINTALSPIPSQIAGLHSHAAQIDQSIASLQSSASAGADKALRIYDAHGNDLGIMVNDLQTVFNPTLGKIIRIHGTGLVGQAIPAWYTTSDCTGTAYTNQSSFDQSQFVFNVAGVHMEVDTSVPAIPTLIFNSFMSPNYPPNNHCTNISSQPVPQELDNVLTLKQIASPYQEPVPFPLTIKYH